MPPAKLTSPKRFAVRLSLVTGSTLATIIGAQSLASLDQQASFVPDAAAPIVINPQLQQQAVPPATAGNQALQPVTPGNSAEVVHAAPTITILRHPGQQAGATMTGSTAASIKPPEPIQIAAPQPVIIQEQSAPTVIQVAGPAPAASAPAASQPPTTRSSR